MKLFVTVFAVMLAACSSQAVQLQPQVVSAQFPAANGELIKLAVRDERPSELVGTRGDTTRLGDVTVAGDIQATVARTLSDAFNDAGFQVQLATSSEASLVVDIRHVAFEEHTGVATNKRFAEAAVSARVMRGSTILFERLYRGSSENRGLFAGSASGNASLVNTAMSEALQKLASDKELLTALVSTGH